MKLKKWVIILFLAAVFTSCADRSRVAVVNADTNTDANFDELKTYAFASQVNNQLDEGFYFLNDLVLKSKIRQSVEHELQSKGYRKDAQNPDMVVNFRVFDKETQIQSMNQMGDQYWSGMAVNEPAQRQTFNLESGSIMIHLVDKESGNLLWQGYASGIMENNVLTHEDHKIKEAVSLVFNQFNQRADDLGDASR